MSSKGLMNSYKRKRKAKGKNGSKKLKTEPIEPETESEAAKEDIELPLVKPESIILDADPAEKKALLQPVDKLDAIPEEDQETESEKDESAEDEKTKDETDETTDNERDKGSPLKNSYHKNIPSLMRTPSLALIAATSSSSNPTNSSSVAPNASSSSSTINTNNMIRSWSEVEQARFMMDHEGKVVTAYRFLNAKYQSINGYQYEPGKTFSLKSHESPELCKSGFHASPTALQAWEHAEDEFGPSQRGNLKLMRVFGQGPFVVGPDKLAFTTILQKEVTDLKEQNELLTGIVQNNHDGWIRHYVDSKLHRDKDLPAMYNPTNQSQQWYQRGMLHREGDKPCLISRDGMYHECRQFGQLHTTDPTIPAIVDQAKKEQKYYSWDRLVNVKPIPTLSSSSSSSSSFSPPVSNQVVPSVVAQAIPTVSTSVSIRALPMNKMSMLGTFPRKFSSSIRSAIASLVSSSSSASSINPN